MVETGSISCVTPLLLKHLYLWYEKSTPKVSAESGIYWSIYTGVLDSNNIPSYIAVWILIIYAPLFVF